ncbi:hypothetical protein ALC152_05230 [Arcobacter sp. 15-2]|uniref:hypothetical protein n=1 Tax=Arcobacter sp. 15-2 TaxID=3374109 RepID=UPI00399C9902
MKQFSKLNNNFNEEKVQKLKLKLSKNNSLSSNKSASSNSNSSIKVSKGNRGITIDNKTVIFNTRYEESGRFNKRLDKTANNKDIGQRAKAAIKYQDRETELEAENELEIGESLDKDMSHSYDLEKQLSKEDIKQINSDLDKGVPAMRTSVLSLGQDKNLSEKEELAVIQKSISEHNSKYNKSVKTVITQHKDTNNRHAHIVQYGSKDDIKMSKEQTENFKLRVAINTKKELDRKGISHKLDKEIDLILDKQEKLLQVENTLDKLQDKVKELSQERLNSIDKETDKIVDKLELSQDQLDAIKNYEKASGYKQFLEKQDKPDPAKIAKAEQWKESIKSKMDEKTIDKHTQLKQELDKFNQSKEFKDINDKFKNDIKEAHRESTKELRELSKKYEPNLFKKGDKQHSEFLSKSASRLEKRTNNIDNKKFKKVSLDSVLNKAEASERETAKDIVSDIQKDIKQMSKEMTKEASRDKSESYNDKKGGLFLENDKVSKSDADEIKQTLNSIDNKRESEKNMYKVANSTDLEEKLNQSVSKRQKYSKNQQSAEFREAQTSFFNIQAVMRDEVNLEKVNSYVEHAVSTSRMTEENGKRFLSNAETHAKELEKAGILKHQGDGKFKFTDERSKEILYDNHDKSINKISSINKSDLKEFKKERDIYKKTNSTKDLKRLQKEVKNKKSKEKELKKNIDFRNQYLK